MKVKELTEENTGKNENKMWLCITTYSDPKRTTVRRITYYRSNAYRRIDLYDRKTHKTYVADNSRVYNLDFDNMRITEEHGLK